MLVDELLVVGDQRLGNGLTDGVDLRSLTTTGDADTDVDVGELVEADNEDGLVDLWDYVSIGSCIALAAARYDTSVNSEN